MVRIVWWCFVVAGCGFVGTPASAQQSLSGTHRSHETHKSRKQPKPSVKIAAAFHPTCNLDSNSVGFYFFPPNVGAKWTIRTVSQILNAQNKVLKTDTAYRFERITSDSNRSMQGLPVLRCVSSYSYAFGGEDTAKLKDAEYYVDDSVIVAVTNHSVSNALSHILLVNPLRLGASWRDDAADTTRSRIIALDEPVTTVLGTFPHALVVQSRLGSGELSKYFVKGVGIVKTVYRGVTPSEDGILVVISELSQLDSGDPKESITRRFPKFVVKQGGSTPKGSKPSTAPKSKIKKQ